MTAEERLDFKALLGLLQERLGDRLNVELALDPERFFGVRFAGSLERVETVDPDGSVVLNFSNGVSVDLAPGEQSVYRLGELVRVEVGGFVVLEILPA